MFRERNPPAIPHSYTRSDIFCHWHNSCVAIDMENNSTDSFIGSMTDILRVGLTVCDAMKQSIRERRRTVRVHVEEHDWMVEITDAPHRAIMITLVE